jgi:hypothetical protein
LLIISKIKEEQEEEESEGVTDFFSKVIAKQNCCSSNEMKTTFPSFFN